MPDKANLDKAARPRIWFYTDGCSPGLDAPHAADLQEIIQELYPDAPRPELAFQPYGRAQVLLQQILAQSGSGGPSGNDDLPAGAIPLAPGGLLDWRPDVIVFDLHAELNAPLWRQTDGGRVVNISDESLANLPAQDKNRFLRRFEPLAGQSAAEFQEHFLQLVRLLKKRLDAHLLVTGVSSFDPHDRVRSYARSGQTPALQAHRFNLALLEISRLEGAAVLDVDRLVAELGAAGQVEHAFRYSPAVKAAIRDELVRILAELGLFSGPAEHLLLSMPYIDRQITGGTILRWHKREGDRLATGDDLFDFRVDEIIKLKRLGKSWILPEETVEFTRRDLEFTLRVSASAQGYLARILAGEGEYCRVGQALADIAAGPETVLPAETPAGMPQLRIVTNIVME